MASFYHYISSFFSGLRSLLQGMRITLLHFFRPKVTECYPENRAALRMPERFRGTLTLLSDESGNTKCIACGICEMNCPNQTIRITAVKETTPEGKTVRRLATYRYDLGSCIFCQLCVRGCPHDALAFDQRFEHALFTRSKLIRELYPAADSAEKQS